MRAYQNEAMAEVVDDSQISKAKKKPNNKVFKLGPKGGSQRRKNSK